MVHALVPTRAELAARLPAKYGPHAGISPYYLPIFGRMFAKRLRDCLDTVRRHASDPGTILDVGCGIGLASAALAEMYPRANIVGLDAAPVDFLRYATDIRPGSRRVRFLNGSAEEVPLQDGRFDLVTAFDVLEHVPHPRVALGEVARLLAPHGIAVISVPIESPILRVLRYVALLGGRKGCIKPHWQGTFRSLDQFEAAWRDHFTPLAVFNTPLRRAPRVVNYDVLFVGRPKAR